MNLLGRGTGLFFLSALFVFSSCKDELNKIGRNVDQDEFQIYYKEFLLPATTVLFDSVRTDNTPRFLVGKYNDGLFGAIESIPYMAFHTSLSRLDLLSTVKDSILVDVRIDSMVFNTALDFYHYGENSGVDESFTVNLHKVNNKFLSDDYHFNYSSFDFEINPLASFNMIYNTDSLNNADSIYNFSAKLPEFYVEELRNIIIANTFDHPFDSAYNRLKQLVPIDSTVGSSISDNLFGFALKADNTAKDVIGLDRSRSNLGIYYHLPNDTSATVLYMGFNLSSNFNNISSDRSSSSTAEIIEKEIAYELGGTRYVQAGTGIMTQINLDEVLDSLSTHENLIVSSVELAFENVNTSELLPSPDNFILLNSTEQFRREPVTLNGEDINIIYDDTGVGYIFPFDATNNLYKGIPRRYFQDLYENDIIKSNLMVQPTFNGYSLDRFTINDGDIKLKIYYSLPK